MKMRKKKKRLIILFFIVGLIVLGGLSTSVRFLSRNEVEAKSISETLDMIGYKNPINIIISTRQQLLETEKAQIIVEKEKERIEEKRKEIKEAIRLEIEKKRVEEEKKRIEEEKKRIEEEKLKLEEAARLRREKKERGKIAYLTFDDGPSEKITPIILDILWEYDIKATFFVVGNMVEKYPDIVRRTFEEGHSVGNHSYSHNYGYIYKNTNNFIADLNKAEDLLRKILGEGFDSKIIRFPGGSFGRAKAPMRKAVIDHGYKYIDWNSLNGDAEGLNMTRQQLINRLKETTKNKKEAIILMHDTDAKAKTAESLRDILDYLISEGYYFDVLDENYQ